MLVLLHRLKSTISLPVFFIIFYKFFNLIIASGQLRFNLAISNISEHGINDNIVSNPIKGCYCINGGKCIGSKCVCPLGYWGENCEKCIPNSRCKGFCRRGPGECTCPFGKGGQFCEKDLVFCTKNSPCQNGGICQNNAEGNYTCKCIPGFGGRNCERKLTKCEEEPCYNGAKCIPSFSYPGFRCSCSSILGLFGRFCEIKAPNGCLDLPCQNGGSCIDYSSNTIHNNLFKCICPEGWTGPLCELPWGYCSENPCQNGGSCVTDNLNEKGYVCFCKPGWSGVNCEDKINNCLINPCLNGGICFNSMNAFRCYCTNQWEDKMIFDLIFFLNLFALIPCFNGETIDMDYLRLLDDRLMYSIEYKPIDQFQVDIEEKEGKLVQITSPDQEQYKCLIPTINTYSKKRIEAYTGPSPAQLLNPIYDQSICSYKFEAYWNYELCHGRYVLQYHEEKDTKKRTEFFLGNYVSVAAVVEAKNFDQLNPPTKKIGDEVRAYYPVTYSHGTLCDLNGKPRQTVVLYVCEENAQQNIYSFTEISSCHYEIIVFANELCAHPAFQIMPRKEHEIKCFPLSKLHTEDPK
uniref:Uncharacterized protein n=1 Tax=Meloidogyne javanica TaxID=6303 RepID=A0A915MCX2_MELJA